LGATAATARTSATAVRPSPAIQLFRETAGQRRMDGLSEPGRHHRNHKSGRAYRFFLSGHLHRSPDLGYEVPAVERIADPHDRMTAG